MQDFDKTWWIVRIHKWRCACGQEFHFGQFIWMFGLGCFLQIYGSLSCPQLILNDLIGFDKIVRLRKGDVHMVKNLIFDNLYLRYGVWT